MTDTNFYYSKTTNLFYPLAWLSDYEAAGSLPDDIAEISDELVAEFSCSVKDGKQRTPGADGLPSWTDLPAPTKEELVILAEQQRTTRRTAADLEIAWRQDAVDAEIASDQEATELAAWKKYRVLLMRIDTSKAPGIEWPTPPASAAS